MITINREALRVILNFLNIVLSQLEEAIYGSGHKNLINAMISLRDAQAALRDYLYVTEGDNA